MQCVHTVVGVPEVDAQGKQGIVLDASASNLILGCARVDFGWKSARQSVNCVFARCFF